MEECLRRPVARHFFVLYVAGIGLWKEIRDVFRYHGAEHKTINAFEAGVDMTPENVMNYSRIHPRCGTSFLLIVVIVSIIVFSIAGHGSLLWKIMMRVLLLPVVVGISYEIIGSIVYTKVRKDHLVACFVISIPDYERTEY